LSGAQLLGVNLSGAQLQGADLNGPIFGSANLKQAILDTANLTDSDITVEQLWQAASFAGAKLPPEVEQQLRQAAPGDDGKEGAVPRRL
ncbi:MAG TPA: pentapeptide repeat-containing protein, partial [Roseiflexaceae bacterium]|nr:pentapeptide repeat-containing protein [Roseiflexaceae bacterium]